MLALTYQRTLVGDLEFQAKERRFTLYSYLLAAATTTKTIPGTKSKAAPFDSCYHGSSVNISNSNLPASVGADINNNDFDIPINSSNSASDIFGFSVHDTEEGVYEA